MSILELERLPSLREPYAPDVVEVAVPVFAARRGWVPTALTWLLIEFYGVFSIATAILTTRGPSFDEGIYAAAGLRTLAGQGIYDNYLSWFAGSLLWPMMSGAVYGPFGIAGSRVLAAALLTVAIPASAKAAGNLFGRGARLWTAALLVGSGPVLELGHLAEYDAVAACGLAVGLWCVSELVVRDDRRWLLGAGLAFGLAVLGKYAVAFVAFAPLSVLWLRRGRRRIDALLLLMLVGGTLLAYFLPYRSRLAEFPSFRVENNPDFGASTAAILSRLGLQVGVLAALAVLGVFLAHRRRPQAAALVAALLLWPAYHVLVAGNAVGASKHVVFGALCAAPVAAVVFARLSASGWVGRVVAVAVVGALAAGGVHDMRLTDRMWPDTVDATSYLVDNVQPGDTMMIDNAWPYRAVLLRNDIIDDPFSTVFDGYNIEHGQGPVDLCTVDWFVEEIGAAFPWPPAVKSELGRCNSFEPVQIGDQSVVGFSPDLGRYAPYNVHRIVWKNTRPQ